MHTHLNLFVTELEITDGVMHKDRVTTLMHGVRPIGAIPEGDGIMLPSVMVLCHHYRLL